MSRRNGVQGHFPVFTIGNGLTLLFRALAIILASLAIILSIALAVFRAARSVARTLTVTIATIIAVTAIMVAITVTTLVVTVCTIVIPFVAVVPSGRVVTAAAARGGGAATARRSAVTTAITARVESPGGGRGSTSPLDLQEIITPNALVVHLVVGIIGITAALVLDKGKQSAGRSAWCRNVATNEATIAFEFVGKITSSSAMTEASDIEGCSRPRRHG
jgi:small-conductance mechanosensitive channel